MEYFSTSTIRSILGKILLNPLRHEIFLRDQEREVAISDSYSLLDTVLGTPQLPLGMSSSPFKNKETEVQRG